MIMPQLHMRNLMHIEIKECTQPGECGAGIKPRVPGARTQPMALLKSALISSLCRVGLLQTIDNPETISASKMYAQIARAVFPLLICRLI